MLKRWVNVILASLSPSKRSRKLAPPKGILPITHFDLSRYLGRWYEIARLDHPFEHGLQQVSAEYSLRRDGGINVINRGVVPESGRWQAAVGRGYPLQGFEYGALKISFWGPIYSGYYIILLDNDYRYALVCGSSRDFLWLMARDKVLPAEVRQQYLAFIQRQGFAVDQLIWVEQQ